MKLVHRRAYLPTLLLCACFGEAPMIDGATEPGTAADSEATTSDAELFCAAIDAIACFDFDASTEVPAGATKTLMGGMLTVVDIPNVSAPNALSASLAGTGPEGVATLHVDHAHDAVLHEFAIQIDPGCVPGEAGVVIAAYSLFASGGDLATTRFELALVADRLLLRRAGLMLDEPILDFEAPTAGVWTSIRWGCSRMDNTLSMTLDTGTESNANTAPVVGSALADGRRSTFGLSSASMTTCTATFDDVLFTEL